MHSTDADAGSTVAVTAYVSLSASAADPDDATLLNIPPGSPIMLREGFNVDDDQQPTM